MGNTPETRYLRIEPALRPSPSETAAALKLDEPVKGMYPRDEYGVIGEKLRHLRVGDKVTYRREFLHKDSCLVLDVAVYRGIEMPEGTQSRKKRNWLAPAAPPRGSEKRFRWRVTKGEIVDDFGAYRKDESLRRLNPIEPVEDVVKIRGGYKSKDFRLRTYMENGETRDTREALTRESMLHHAGRERDLIMIVYKNGMPIAAAEACDISTKEAPATVETGFDVDENHRGAGLSETMLFDLGGIAGAMFGAKHLHLGHLSENTAMGHIANNCVVRAVTNGEVPWGMPHARRNPEDVKEKFVDISLQNGK